MDVPFASVQRGDLITSDLFNQLLVEVNKLRDRVTVLEGASAVGDVGIQTLLPANAVRPGDTLSVFGFGFGVSLGVCRVKIDEVEIPFADLKAGSTDKMLVFQIPDALEDTIPAGGRAALLKVFGLRGSATVQLRLNPSRLVAQGTVQFQFLSATPDRIAPAPTPPPVISYRARSLAAGAGTATLKLKAVFSGVSDPNAWLQQAVFTDNNGTPLPAGNSLVVPATDDGVPFKLALRALPTPLPATDTSFSVTVSGASDDGLVAGQPDLHTFPIGTAQEPQDPDIFAPTLTVSPDTRDATGTLVVTKGAAATRLTWTVRIKRTGTFRVTSTIEAAGWSSAIDLPSIPVATLPQEGFVERTIQNNVSALASAATPAKLTFKIQQSGAALARTTTLPLKTAPG